MESEQGDFKAKYIPNATTITNKALTRFPNVKHFFENLLANTNILTKNVGESFRYNLDVEQNYYYSAHGLFMDYFIRKHLSNQYNIEIFDYRTEYIIDKPDVFIISTRLRQAIIKHYEIFKDSQTIAMDIINSIKIVSLSHLIYFGDPIPEVAYTVNEDNLREVIRYFESLPYKSVELNPDLDCNYFNADGDLIFDKNIIYEIKTSKFKSLTAGEMEIPLSKFYQPIIYGFGLYKKTGIKVKDYKIYNPLLGAEFTIILDNIDFELFETVLKRDVAVFSSLEEILKDVMVLDLSLFSDEDKKHVVTPQ